MSQEDRLFLKDIFESNDPELQELKEKLMKLQTKIDSLAPNSRSSSKGANSDSDTLLAQFEREVSSSQR